MITFKHVGFSYDGVHKILDGFSLSLPDKGVCCLSGPSGCGKTTLLRLLAGLEQPQSGNIEGLDTCRPSVVFQENRLLPWETVLNNVVLVNPLPNAEETATRLLIQFGLEDALHQFPSELSGGMKRRVALARALVLPAEFLILDEPFVGLDVELWKDIAAVIQQVYADKLIVLVTHIAEQADIMNAEIISLSGPPLRTPRQVN